MAIVMEPAVNADRFLDADDEASAWSQDSARQCTEDEASHWLGVRGVPQTQEEFVGSKTASCGSDSTASPPFSDSELAPKRRWADMVTDDEDDGLAGENTAQSFAQRQANIHSVTRWAHLNEYSDLLIADRIKTLNAIGYSTGSRASSKGSASSAHAAYVEQCHASNESNSGTGRANPAQPQEQQQQQQQQPQQPPQQPPQQYQQVGMPLTQVFWAPSPTFVTPLAFVPVIAHVPTMDGCNSQQVAGAQPVAPDMKNSTEKPRQAGPASSRRGGQNRQAVGEKWQCQFVIGIVEEPSFKVTRRVLGPAGAHMKRIAADTGVKLRLRGKGSKFLEGPEKRESSDPLMLCISAQYARAYETAVRRVKELLDGVYHDYDAFCVRVGLPAPHLKANMHEGARDGARPSKACGTSKLRKSHAGLSLCTLVDAETSS